MLKIKDIDQLILAKLTDTDLYTFIYATKNNKYLNRICNDKNFWYKKMMQKDSEWEMSYPCQTSHLNSYILNISFQIFCNNNQLVSIINTKNVTHDAFSNFEDLPVNFFLDFQEDTHEFYMKNINLKILTSHEFKIYVSDLDSLSVPKIKEFVSGEFFKFANLLLERKDERKKKLVIFTQSDPYKSQFYLNKSLRCRPNFYLC